MGENSRHSGVVGNISAGACEVYGCTDVGISSRSGAVGKIFSRVCDLQGCTEVGNTRRNGAVGEIFSGVCNVHGCADVGQFVGDDIHSGVSGDNFGRGDVECMELTNPTIFLGCENVGEHEVEKSAMNVGEATGGSDVKSQSDVPQIEPTENVALVDSYHAHSTHAQQPSTLRHWKCSACRGGANVPRIVTVSSKKRKGRTGSGYGDSTRRVKRGRCVNTVELEGTQETMEAEIQPRRPL